MKYNDTFRLIGIVCIIYGLQGIVFPLLKAIFSHEILFEFFYCFILGSTDYISMFYCGRCMYDAIYKTIFQTKKSTEINGAKI